MLIIGLAHALFTPDIVALYGLCAIDLAGVIVSASNVATVQPSPLIVPDLTQAEPLLLDGRSVGAVRILGLAPAVLLGAWAARHGP